MSEINEIPNEVRILKDDINRVINAFNQLNHFKSIHIRYTDIEFLYVKAKALVESIEQFRGWFGYWKDRNWKEEEEDL